jgi:hypothetical protein
MGKLDVPKVLTLRFAKGTDGRRDISRDSWVLIDAAGSEKRRGSCPVLDSCAIAKGGYGGRCKKGGREIPRREGRLYNE